MHFRARPSSSVLFAASLAIALVGCPRKKTDEAKQETSACHSPHVIEPEIIQIDDKQMKQIFRQGLTSQIFDASKVVCLKVGKTYTLQGVAYEPKTKMLYELRQALQ